MSVKISNMKKPTHCKECRLYNSDEIGCFCAGLSKEDRDWVCIQRDDKLPFWCPLEEVK